MPERVCATERVNDEVWFAISDRPPSLETAKTSLPKTWRILWDASGSRSDEDVKASRAVIDRLPELALNTANGNDLLVHHFELHPEYDYYFQLFATAPYMRPETIRACWEKLTCSAEYDSCFTATENHSFYWLAGNPVNYRPEILPRSQDMLPMIEETTGLYGISGEALRKYRCRIGRKPYIHIVSRFEAVDINTEEDWKLAEYVGRAILGLE